MHDFVSYLFYLLQRGMRFAVPAALICVNQYVQGIRCDYLNGAALNRWEM